ncbi:phosphatase PAP2 family protein [Candidatus Woesearchaeota archaeon]|nr:phosphatase PAP2 family protein [Candidatus Woesearchaeota archaeon]
MNARTWGYGLGIIGIAIVIALFLDSWVVQLIPSLRTSLLTTIFFFLGSAPSLAGFIVLVGMSFVFEKEKRQKIPYFILAVLVAIAISYGLKYLIVRPRPEILPLLVKSSPSFPSTHAAVAGAMYFFILGLNKVERNGLLLLALLVALSGLYNGVHYLSDVIAGVALGMIISYVSDRRIPVWIRKKRAASQQS